MPAIDIGREIKYRAWDVLRNKMHYLCEEHATIIKGCFSEIYLKREDGQYEWRKISSEQIILLQFTGLQDKNGKMIFESDIVHRIATDGGKVFWDFIAVIKYREDCMAFHFDKVRDIEDNIESHDLVADVITEEVLGNIYEHTSLLEEQSGGV